MVFTSPFAWDQLEEFRKEMDGLIAWDDEYFKRRTKLMDELDRVVAAVFKTGDRDYHSLTTDVKEYLSPAKDILQSSHDLGNKTVTLLEKKLKVRCPSKTVLF